MTNKQLYYTAFFRWDRGEKTVKQIKELWEIINIPTNRKVIEFAVNRTLINLKK